VGYSVYITRRELWSEEGPSISLEEWKACVACDSELCIDAENGEGFAVWLAKSESEGRWLCWSNGNIEAKYPDELLLKKMRSISKQLGASVQGDDGELYGEGGVIAPSPKSSVLSRLETWWRSKASRRVPREVVALPFKVGDRVVSIVGPWHGTVIGIDVNANQGLGQIAVRRDDGEVIYQAVLGHGLVPESRGGISA
jgi:hypothetical protein